MSAAAKKGKWGRRTSFILLLCVIVAFGVLNWPKESKLLILPTKSSLANVTEYVLVFDYTETIQCRNKSTNIMLLLWSDDDFIRDNMFCPAINHNSPGWDGRFRIWYRCNPQHNSFNWSIVSINNYYAFHKQNESRGFAMISNNSFDSVGYFIKFLSFIIDFIGLFNSYSYEEISSFRCLKEIGGFSSNIDGFFHVPGLFLGGFPEFFSGYKQGQCEESDGGSSTGSNKITMTFNPFSNRNDSFFKDREERDQFIQGILFVLWIIFLLCFYWKNRLT